MKKVLNVFGDICSEKWCNEDVTPSEVSAFLVGLTASDELEIDINCFGGEVFAAVAIASMIEKSPAKKTFNVIGVCASAATMLFNATDKVNISKGAMLMYHKPLVRMQGNANDFRKQIELLDKIEIENIISPLIARTKKPINEISDLIANEWWLNSDEAVQNLGFTLLGTAAIENSVATKQENIYKNYIEKKKACSASNAFTSFINIKNSLK